MNRPEIAVIVARARNGVIGRDNGLPWRLREDLARFKQRTLGSPVVMGRKTWESLGRPLPGRLNVVITRQAGYAAEGARVVHSLAQAVAACAGAARVFVIGGAEIYAQALDLADVLWITEVDADVTGDAHFPAFDAQRFEAVTREAFAASTDNDHAFEIVEYRRRPSA
ncbi:MAG: dihydrofolate reductase [Candidatus Dactylopiibacterium sp.]|nr:dihydrofolate reductase [Candidatus Dactylopiibacterium sp.]